MSSAEIQSWNTRYQGESYLFGETPNAFLAAQRKWLRPGEKALAVADGEGRNGVWLAGQGLDVLSIDASAVAQDKARRLAQRLAVKMRFECVDLSHWFFPEAEFDVIAAIFIQFAGPALRSELFKGMKQALRPGGRLVVQGYSPEQLQFGTGGPRLVENLYTESMLREAFADMEILVLNSHESVIEEGSGHRGMSSLIDLVARKAG